MSRRAAVNMADRCRFVIEAVLKYAQELLGNSGNLNLPADLKVCFDTGRVHNQAEGL